MTQFFDSRAEITTDDLQKAERVGLSHADLQKQLELLRMSNPRYTVAARACTVGDGILAPNQELQEHYCAVGAGVISAGKLLDFIPASGAATRMFKSLTEVEAKGSVFLKNVPNRAAEGDSVAKSVLSIFESLPKFAFFQPLRDSVLANSLGTVDMEELSGAELLSHGHGPLVLSSLLSPQGLNFLHVPKALIPFHRYSDGDVRDALTEHLHTAADLGADKECICRVHFTCSRDEIDNFRTKSSSAAAAIRERRGISFDISFSVQEPRFDMLCITPDGLPLRENGELVLRPGGHGALLHNLNELAKAGADIVSIGNIDNVHPERNREEFLTSKRMLVGILSEIQERAHGAIRQLLGPPLSTDSLDEMYTRLVGELGFSVPGWWTAGPSWEKKTELLTAALNRPIRVVGVVRNTGEPGGGPFWVHQPDGGTSKQVVEQIELNPADPSQHALFKNGTHFNPVRLICGLRDYSGQPHNLWDFTNPDAMMRSTKDLEGGQRVKIIEWPGLWNGSMARWLTTFVEVPAETFAPVKTLADLARAEHQC